MTTRYGNPPQGAPFSLDLDNLFTYHSPFGDQQERYVALRDKAKELAVLITDSCPPSADTSAAVRLLREALMTANSSIACGEKQENEKPSDQPVLVR